jgi:hypothetical protein
MQTLKRLACLAAGLGLASMAGAQQLPDNDAAPQSQTPIFAQTPTQGSGSYLALGDHIYGPVALGAAGDTGLLGVEELNGHFYVSGRSTGVGARKIYRFDQAGALQGTYTQNSGAASAWGHRDLASDGVNKLYGGEENGHFAEYTADGAGNLGAGTMFSVPGVGTIRALAKDPTGPKDFWTADFNGVIFAFSIMPVAVTGNFGNPGKAFYGFAVNPTDNNFVWGYSQNGPTAGFDLNEFNEMNRSLGWQLTGQTFQGITHGVAATNIAGGVDFWDDGTDSTYKLLALHQFTVDELNGYDSGIASGTATTPFCTAKSGLVCGTPSISASGTSSVTANSGFVVSAGPARDNRSGILMYNNQGVVAGLPFQGGTLCVNSMGIRRAGSTNSMGSCPPTPIGCAGSFSIDMNAFAQAAWVVPDCAGNPAGIAPNNPAAFLVVAGTTIDCQFWGRDSVATGSFVSDGLSYTQGP